MTLHHVVKFFINLLVFLLSCGGQNVGGINIRAIIASVLLLVQGLEVKWTKSEGNLERDCLFFFFKHWFQIKSAKDLTACRSMQSTFMKSHNILRHTSFITTNWPKRFFITDHNVCKSKLNGSVKHINNNNSIVQFVLRYCRTQDVNVSGHSSSNIQFRRGKENRLRTISVSQVVYSIHTLL